MTGSRRTLDWGVRARTLAGVVAIASAIAASARAGDDDDDPAVGDATGASAPLAGSVLVARDATWQLQWAAAPALTVALGASALGALDAARGGPAAPSLYGPADAGPPAAWPFAVDGDVVGRLAVAGGALPAPAPDQRIAAASAWAMRRICCAKPRASSSSVSTRAAKAATS